MEIYNLPTQFIAGALFFLHKLKHLKCL